MRKKRTTRSHVLILPTIRRLGIPISARSCHKNYEFDGGTIALRARLYSQNRLDWRTLNRDPSDVMHDAAHWLCAASWRRTAPDFGLGQTNSFLWSRRLVTYEEATLEENRASLLGIMMELECGEAWKDTFDYHSWSSGGMDVVWETLGALQRNGFLDFPVLLDHHATMKALLEHARERTDA